ncbi:MAG: hypothetical protein ACREX8_07425 [Gammaproteobacteria bacterium]
MATATRLSVISDLHLGGIAPYMMSKPERLAAFIGSLPGRLAADEALALVIAGDFIDFLAIPGFKSWTADPREACTKLELTLRGPFAPVFDALRRHVASGYRLTVLIGNHDIELALPAVQDAFLRDIGAGSHQVGFIDDGSAYRAGGVLIEHGNRYDGANSNDWEGLRSIRSAQSRHEPPPRALAVAAGSVIVEKVVNAIKPRYPFIDLLQPQDRLLAYLLLAFEPSLLRRNLSKLGAILKGAWREGENPLGVQPVRTREVGAEIDSPLDPALESELQATFGADYERLERPASTVAAGDWLPIAGQFAQDGLAQLIEQDRAIPPERLRQMPVLWAMRSGMAESSYRNPMRAMGSLARLRAASSSSGPSCLTVAKLYTGESCSRVRWKRYQ